MTAFWLVRSSVSPPLFYCRRPFSHWSVCRSRLHCSLVDDRVLICPYVGLASIVLLSMTMFWLVTRSVSSPLFYCAWPCSDLSLVGLVSVVLLCMTVFWLVRRLVSHPLFYCRWPRSDWSVVRSRLHCSIVDDRVLIDPWVGLASIVLLSMTMF